MITIAIALTSTLLVVQPEDALVGVWKAGDQTFTFFSNTSARFVYLERFGILKGVRPVPDGTWLGYWAAYERPFTGVDAAVPAADRTVGGLPRASQGHWRARFTKTDAKGYPQSATLKMETARPSQLFEGDLKYICGLDQVSIDGLYATDQISLDVQLVGSTLRGTLECYKLQYAISATALEGLMVAKLVDPSTGKEVGSCRMAWNPTSSVLSRLAAGQRIPTDRILINVASTMDKQRASITRILTRRER